MKMWKLLLEAIRAYIVDYNWCHNEDSQGNIKPFNWGQEIYRRMFWPIPDMKPQPCWCCASFRGILYGVFIGAVLHKAYTIYGENFIAWCWIALWIFLAFSVIMIGRRFKRLWKESK